MKKISSIIISLFLVLVFVGASGTTGSALAHPPTVTPTEEVTPTPTESGPTCTPTPTEEVTLTPTEELTITPTEKVTETPTPTKEVTSTPSTSSGPTAIPTPTVAVLGVTTMAKTGSFEQGLMNLLGIFGMLFITAGSVIYATKQRS